MPRCAVTLGLGALSASWEGVETAGLVSRAEPNTPQIGEEGELPTIGLPNPNFVGDTPNAAHKRTQRSNWPPRGRVPFAERVHVLFPGKTPQPQIGPAQRYCWGRCNTDSNPFWHVGLSRFPSRDGRACTDLQSKPGYESPHSRNPNQMTGNPKWASVATLGW